MSVVRCRYLENAEAIISGFKLLQLNISAVTVRIIIFPPCQETASAISGTDIKLTRIQMGH